MATKVGGGLTSDYIVQRAKKKIKAGAFYQVLLISQKKMRTHINVRLSNVVVIHNLDKSCFS